MLDNMNRRGIIYYANGDKYEGKWVWQYDE